MEEKRDAFNKLLMPIPEAAQSFVFCGMTLKIISILYDLEQPRIVQYHQHPDFEITICENGGFINRSEAMTSSFQRNDHAILIMPPATLHEREYTRKQTLNLTFGIEIVSMNTSGKYALMQLQDICLHQKFKFPLNGISRTLFWQFKKTLPSLGTDDPLTAGLLASAFISSVFHSCFGTIQSLPQKEISSRDSMILRIRSCVHKYLNGKYFPGNYLQNNFNLSVNYLNRIFRQATGMSIRNYWKKERLAQIHSLIINTDTKFSEIARIMGFCNAAQFSAYVHHHFGKTPSKIRNDAKI